MVQQMWLTVLAAYVAGWSGPARADPVVTVTVGIPRLVVVVGTGIRYCVECDEDVFYYGDVWWVYRSNGWYRCTRWGAPWVLVSRGRLPAVFMRVPPGQFRHRWGPYHPAHDHHPKLDRWNRDHRRDAGPGEVRGQERPGNAGPTVSGDKDKDQGSGKGKKDKKGRGNKGGHGRK